MKKNLAVRRLLDYSLDMKETAAQDIETIKRIAQIAGLPVRAEKNGLVIIEKNEGLSGGFYWSSNEDFGDFIQELLSWQYDKGYDRKC